MNPTPPNDAAPVVDNTERSRFEMAEQDQIVFADYRLAEGRLSITHVESPPALRGAGAAGRLMAGVIVDARRRGLKIEPLCGYAVAWMRRHPEHADLLD